MYRRNCSCSGNSQKPMGMYPQQMTAGQWPMPQTAAAPISQPMHGGPPSQMSQPWGQMPMPAGHPTQAMPAGMPWDTTGTDPSLLGQQQYSPEAVPMMMPQSMQGAMPGYGVGPMAGAAPGMPWQQMPGAMPGIMPGAQTAPMPGMQQWPTATPYGTGGCC